MLDVKFSTIHRHYTHLTKTYLVLYNIGTYYLLLHFRSIVCGLFFVSSGSYVNLSRIDPDLLCSVDSRISFLDTQKTAACVLVGFATASNIADYVE